MNKFDYIAWIRGSVDNSPGGASSKKLTAFWSIVIITTPVVYCWTIWAFIHNDWALLPSVLTALLGFTAAGLGINAIEKIKGKTNENTNAPEPGAPAP